jgi:hypothetical protein
LYLLILAKEIKKSRKYDDDVPRQAQDNKQSYMD